MLSRLVAIISYVGIGSVVCMTLVTGVDITGRYAFNKPILGVTDLIELLIVIVSGCGIAITTALDDHISVDSVYEKLPSLGQHVLRVLAGIVSTFVFGILTLQGFQGGIDAAKLGKMTHTLEIPHFPFMFFLTFGFLASMIFSIRQIVLFLRNKKG